MSKFSPFLIVFLVVAVFAVGAYFMLNQNLTSQTNLNLTQTPTPTGAIINSQDQTQMVDFNTTDSGLKIKDEVVGEGPEVKTGDTVTVHYTGTLENGSKFDSSYDRNQPFTTRIGVGEVIKGWDEGILGMSKGGKRKLVIPADLGYGSQDLGTIPPNSTLLFEVELLSIN